MKLTESWMKLQVVSCVTFLMLAAGFSYPAQASESDYNKAARDICMSIDASAYASVYVAASRHFNNKSYATVAQQNFNTAATKASAAYFEALDGYYDFANDMSYNAYFYAFQAYDLNADAAAYAAQLAKGQTQVIINLLSAAYNAQGNAAVSAQAIAYSYANYVR